MQGSGKLLPVAFPAWDNGYCSIILGKSLINIKHAQGFFLGLFRGSVGRVSFLPEKLCSAEKQPCAHFPAEDIAPLVDQKRQVAVGHDPFFEHGPDYRLRSWPNYKWLFQFLATSVSYHRALRCKTLHMFSLFLEKTLGD